MNILMMMEGQISIITMILLLQIQNIGAFFGLSPSSLRPSTYVSCSHRKRLEQGSSRRNVPPRSLQAVPQAEAGKDVETLFRTWFRGEFDNAGQVQEERKAGLEPGESGGHEQIHCRLEPLDLPQNSLGGSTYFIGATYYFDNRPGAVFRCRVYSFHPPSKEDPPETLTEMRLHRFVPDFEGYMRRNKYNLSLLPRSSSSELNAVVEELEGCSILWSWDDKNEGFRGIMKHGSGIVKSQRDVEVTLRIEDDLLLQADRLYVNDRGTNCATGKLVYGNHRSVPYMIERRS